MTQNKKLMIRMSRVEIKNFRGVKSLSITPRQNTIIVGPNNVGKSTLVTAIAKLGSLRRAATLDISDFNIDLLKNIFKHRKDPSFLRKNLDELVMSLEIQYEWENVPPYLFDLMNSTETFGSSTAKVTVMLDSNKVSELANETDAKNLSSFFVVNHEIYSKYLNAWIPADDRLKSILFPSKDVSRMGKSVQTIFHISADRRVDSGENGNESLTAKIFKGRLDSTVESTAFKTEFEKINSAIRTSVADETSKMKEELKSFSFPKGDVSDLDVLPNVDAWANNPTVRVSQNYAEYGIELPISRQGLGYQNIFNILGQIGNAIGQINKRIEETDSSRHAVLFVIEEPEVYTHPQLQHVFIQKVISHIKERLSDELDVQILIISHSAEVAVAAIDIENPFSVIRLSEGNEPQRVESTFWDDLQYSTPKLTSLLLNYNAELLFAEKVVLIEGDSERAIIKAIMRRLDSELTHSPDGLDEYGLQSQQIAIVPVGKSIAGIKDGLEKLNFKKVLMFTDLDFSDSEGKSFDFTESVTSTNPTIREYFNVREDIQDKFAYKPDAFYEKIPGLEDARVYTQNWVTNNFLPMTLEPAFLNTGNNYEKLNGLFTKTVKPMSNEVHPKNDDKVGLAFEIAEKIQPRNLDDQIDIPLYLREGLLWLKS